MSDTLTRKHVERVLNDAYLGCAIAGVLDEPGGDRADAIQHVIDTLWEALLGEPAPFQRKAS